MYHADTRLQRVERRVEFHFLAVNQDVAAVAAGLPDDVHAEEYFHQGAFARAVLAAQAQNLALTQGKIDIGEDLIAKEVLFDVLHLQQGVHVVCHTSTLSHLFRAPVPGAGRGLMPPRSKPARGGGQVLLPVRQTIFESNQLTVKYFSGISTSALPMKRPGSPMI